MRRTRRFSAADREYIASAAATQTAAEIALHLGRTACGLRKWCAQQGIILQREQVQYSPSKRRLRSCPITGAVSGRGS